jgi:putative selenium metabolism hydrolase
MNVLGYREVLRDDLGSVVGLVGPARAPVRVLFDGHMDIVPPAGKWTVDPFGGEVRDGRLFGRGSADMKSGLAAAITGIARAASTGTLVAQVAVSATVLEETIEGAALASVMDRLHPENVIIPEPSNLAIKIGQRGRLEVLITALGSPSHAAYPERGVNAVQLMARALVALEALRPPYDADLGYGILVPTDVVSDPHPSVSLLPNSVTARFDRRLLVGETMNDVLSEVTACLDQVAPGAFVVRVPAGEERAYTGVAVNPPHFLPAWKVSRGSALAQVVEQAARAAGIDPAWGYYGFCTNASESAGVRGVPTIGLGPGEESDAHTADESVPVAQVVAAEEIYREIALRLAG